MKVFSNFPFTVVYTEFTLVLVFKKINNNKFKRKKVKKER